MSAFLSRGRVIALAAAALAIIVVGLLAAFTHRRSCDGPCPVPPVDAGGRVVSDQFWFLHRDLGPQDSITVRLTAMTGTITYPPPDHDEIVSGLVPWAKVGIIVKDGTRPGSSYAALMMTGDQGVRMQHDYVHDLAGRPGGVSPQSPRWLRLTRSGDTVTGAESTDGQRWDTVGTVRVAGLPDTARAGLFAASPGDLTLRRVALGATIEENRFTQAVGVFDSISPGGPWRSEPIGEMNQTDWEKYHRAAGATIGNGVVTVAGSGDIGPGAAPSPALPGVAVALVIVLVVAARGRPPGGAVVVGLAALVAGLSGAAVALPAALAVLHRNGAVVQPIGLLTGVRVVAGCAVALALCSVVAYGLGMVWRRGWIAALLLIAVPYVVTSVPLLPDVVSNALLSFTPAAGFAVTQTAVEYPQMTAHHSPIGGYFPLPGWAGLAVLALWAVLALAAGRVRTTARGGS